MKEDEELELFLEEVNYVKAQIDGLKDGSLDVESVDKSILHR